MIWLWAIAANLISQWAFLDIAVRDIEISFGAFALAALSGVKNTTAHGEETSHLSQSRYRYSHERAIPCNHFLTGYSIVLR